MELNGRYQTNLTWSVEGLRKGAEDLTAPTGGGWVGATLGAWKVGSGWSMDLARSRASSLLNRSAHFLSGSFILSSADDVDGLGSVDLDLLDLGFSEAGFLSFFFFSAPELEPGDCSIPWSSTAPTTVTEDGSMREELSELFCGVSPCFLDSHFSFLIL